MAEGFDDMEMRNRDEYEQYNNEELESMMSDTQEKIDRLNRNFKDVGMSLDTTKEYEALVGVRNDIFKKRRHRRLNEIEKKKSRDKLAAMVESQNKIDEEKQHKYEKYSEEELENILNDTKEKIEILYSNFKGVERPPDAREEYKALIKIRNDIYNERDRRQSNMVTKVRNGVSEQVSMLTKFRDAISEHNGEEQAETSFIDNDIVVKGNSLKKPSSISFTDDGGIVILKNSKPPKSITILKEGVSIKAPGIETSVSGDIPSAPGGGM